MFSVVKRDEVLKEFKTEAINMVKEKCADLDLAGFMKNSDVDCIKAAVNKIDSCIIATIPYGIPVPKVSVHITATGEEEVTVVTITVTNKISSSKKFKYTNRFISNDIVENIREFFLDMYADLITDEMIEENLKIVNDVLEEVVNKAGVSYEISVVSPVGQQGKVLSSILDDKVVFVADTERAFELEDIMVLQEPDEDITEEMIASAIEDEVNIVSGCQTPEQLVAKHGGMLVSYVCNINKQIRPMTLIKKVCSKDVMRVKGQNDTFAYYNNGEVFALLYRRDGEFEIALSPFDMKTLRKADFDVLGAIKG